MKEGIKEYRDTMCEFLRTLNKSVSLENKHAVERRLKGLPKDYYTVSKVLYYLLLTKSKDRRDEFIKQIEIALVHFAPHSFEWVLLRTQSYLTSHFGISYLLNKWQELSEQDKHNIRKTLDFLMHIEVARQNVLYSRQINQGKKIREFFTAIRWYTLGRHDLFIGEKDGVENVCEAHKLLLNRVSELASLLENTPVSYKTGEEKKGISVIDKMNIVGISTRDALTMAHLYHDIFRSKLKDDNKSYPEKVEAQYHAAKLSIETFSKMCQARLRNEILDKSKLAFY